MVLDIDATNAADLYSHRLVLSRSDQHVAWRGDVLPADPLALIDRVRSAMTRCKSVVGTVVLRRGKRRS